MAINQREFREALSAFATGVTIVTARDQNGEPVGMTASSFNSVSMDPPLVLWSVTKTAMSAPVFHAAEYFAVHVLGFDQTEISNRFAKRGEDKFGLTPHSSDTNDVPIIEGVASRFDCKTWATYEGGDHWIIVGEVLNFERRRKDGLVFAGGSYAIANPIQGPAKAEDDLMDDAPVENLLFYHLSRAYHQVAGGFHNAVRDSGLTLSEWRILVSLAGQGVSRDLKNLSDRTFIEQPALWDLLCRLEEQGLCLLEREQTETRVRGTQAGEQKIEHLIEMSLETEKSVFGELGTKDAEELFRLLRLVISRTNP